MLNKRQSTTRLPIKPVAEIIQPQSYAFYGRSGSGKTTLAASFPKPLLLLDINDKGIGSVADVRDVHVMEVESMEDIEDVYYALRNKEANFKTVVFDTITEMQRLALNELAEEKKKANTGAWGTLTQKDWGEIAAIMNKWIADFRNLPMEVVFLAQERVSDMENLDTQQITPSVGSALMPSVATTLNAACNVIGNTFIRTERTSKIVNGKQVKNQTTDYCLRVGPNPVYITKIRKPKALEVPEFITDPTYSKLTSIIRGKTQ